MRAFNQPIKNAQTTRTLTIAPITVAEFKNLFNEESPGPLEIQIQIIYDKVKNYLLSTRLDILAISLSWANLDGLLKEGNYAGIIDFFYTFRFLWRKEGNNSVEFKQRLTDRKSLGELDLDIFAWINNSSTLRSGFVKTFEQKRWKAYTIIDKRVVLLASIQHHFGTRCDKYINKTILAYADFGVWADYTEPWCIDPRQIRRCIEPSNLDSHLGNLFLIFQKIPLFPGTIHDIWYTHSKSKDRGKSLALINAIYQIRPDTAQCSREWVETEPITPFKILLNLVLLEANDVTILSRLSPCDIIKIITLIFNK